MYFSELIRSANKPLRISQTNEKERVNIIPPKRIETIRATIYIV